MSNHTRRHPRQRVGDSVEQRLARLLDAPGLARIVPHLPPETLHQLIRRRGLDACGELVASATPAQLSALLDLDLWRPARPGRDQQFDPDRFGEWIDMLVDTGESTAARTVAALDKDLIVAGLSRYIRVLDPGIFEPTAQSDDELPDRHEALREGDSEEGSAGAVADCEVGGYLVRARRADAWDAVVTLLIALDAEQPACFHTVMQGCRDLSNSRPEIDGLDDLLPLPEQHFYDVAGGREHRRARLGYATAADARAFLQMARQPKRTSSGASTGSAAAVNPIVAAYFRAADEASQPADDAAASSARSAQAPLSTAALPAAASAGHGAHVEPDAAEPLEAVLELLAEAGLMPERPRGLLESAGTDSPARHARLRLLLACVRETHATAYFTRTRELAFLANTLLAGCPVQSRPFTPEEASDAAAAVCNLGLEYWPQRWPPDTAPSPHQRDAGAAPGAVLPAPFLIYHDLVTAFEVGWSVLHQDVCLYAADQLVSTLAAVECVDEDVQRGLIALRRRLAQEREAGTPWEAREAAEILTMLDPAIWVSVLGLLAECPVLPAAVTAILEGSLKRVSPTAFEFISTAGQIDDVRLFLRRLPDLLTT